MYKHCIKVANPEYLCRVWNVRSEKKSYMIRPKTKCKKDKDWRRNLKKREILYSFIAWQLLIYIVTSFLKKSQIFAYMWIISKTNFNTSELVSY